MQLRQFVLVCSVMLLGWLGLAFVHEAPSNRYPESVKNADVQSPVAATTSAEISDADELTVSVSP